MTDRGGRRARSLEEIAGAAGAAIEGSPRPSITGVSGLEDAGPGDLSFLAHPRYAPLLAATRASAVLLAPGVAAPPGLGVLRAADPYAAMVRVLPLFDVPRSVPEVGVHASAVVGPGVTLGEGARVGPGAVLEQDAAVGARSVVGPGVVIGRGARVGEDCNLYARTVIGHGCILGDRVVVQPGAVIGGDGFGYAFAGGEFHKVPQVGIVVVEDDVEIGANACIDRATIGSTRIGRGSKIDNLVQVAHNVALGEGCALAAQSGIAGSARLGRGVRLGGQAGVGGHLRIGDGATVGAQGGVIGNVAAGEIVSGYPARSHRKMLRVHACVMQLPEIVRRLRRSPSPESVETERADD